MKYRNSAVFLMGMFVPFVFAQASLLDDIKQEIQQKEEEIRRLELDKKQFEGTIAQKQKAQRTLKEAIAALTADIDRLKIQQKVTSAEISQTELGIRSLGLQIQETEDRITEHKRRMFEIIRVIQENADEHKTLLSLMLRESPFSSFFGQLAYADTIQGELLERTNLFSDSKKRLEQEEADLFGKKTELEELRARLIAENRAKNSQQQQKSTLLVQTKSDEVKFKKLLTDAEKKRQDILKNIKELEDKLRRTIDPASIPAFRPGVIDWPSTGVVSQEYGNTKDTGFINDSYEFHNGIDVAGKTGTPIRSVRDGIVKAIGNNSPYAYGKWIAIDHDNNLTTLYAHLSSYASLKVGSAVKKGQVIAYMGATGFATGSHLHLTVYASNTFITEQRWFGLLPLGGSINPRNYLP